MNEQAVFLPVLEALYDAVMVTDSNGVIILANQATLDSFSLTREQLIGKTPSQLIAEGVYLNSSITKAIETRDTVTEIIHFPMEPADSLPVCPCSMLRETSPWSSPTPALKIY